MWELDERREEAVNKLILSLHPKQKICLNTKANEILWGGSAGGGKSLLLRYASIIWAALIPNLQVYLFRRLYPDLVLTHIEGPNGYKNLLSRWVKAGFVQIVEGEIRFLFNGSKIYLRHCKDEDDKYQYLSTEFHVLLIDELTTFTESQYRFLRSRVRATKIQIPSSHKDYFPRILCASNPVGIGHAFVKKMWIEGKEEGKIYQCEGSEGGMRRCFIRASIHDNPSLMAEDPHYVDRLRGLGSEQLVKAYLDGSWDIVIGAFFPELSLNHQIRPIQIKSHWTKIRCFDWGYAAPFACLWVAIASEETQAETVDGRQITIPKEAAILYREWVGEKDYNVGLRLTPREIAVGIFEREHEGETNYSIADTAIFAQDGGPSIAEQFMQCGLFFLKADKRRIPGWQEMRQRLVGRGGVPMLYFFSTCVKTIRDLPTMMHDEKDPEDATSEGVSDHTIDALRYGLMSRPFVSAKPDEDEKYWLKEVKVQAPTLDELWDITEREKKRSAGDYFKGLEHDV